MILGVGVDMIQVSRIEAAIADPKFLTRIFTAAELAEMKGADSIAGRWAAKEAVIKAVGRTVPWHHIEILKDPEGKPVARLHGEPELDASRLHVSISHDGGMATAFAVLERA